MSEARTVFECEPGHSPLIISMPHVGTELPEALLPRLSDAGRAMVDTDWYVDRLWSFARERGAGWLRARYSRYLIDLNRPPDDHSLYPGQTTTPLCPTETFAGERVYIDAGPDAAEIAQRRESYWQPYHAQLAALIQQRIRQHGFAVLLDAHSILSHVPRLFPGRLPDINVGTYGSRSMNPLLEQRIAALLSAQQRFTHVLNGRFQGGYITRAYGQPAQGVHAIQFEISQCAYMDETTGVCSADSMGPLQTLLSQVPELLISAAAEVAKRGPSGPTGH
jgi:N-formylglutamate deformylase